MLILDIETKPNKKLRKLFAANNNLDGLTEPQIHKMMATDQDYCDIVCIGIKRVGGESRVYDDIKKIGTQDWNIWIEQLPLLTYNGKRFDIPVLIKKGLEAGIELPYKRLYDACKPWNYGDRHIDLMEIISFGRKWKSLDEMLQIYLGIEKKTKGPNFFVKATKKQLMEHCLEDLSLTEQLAKKFRLL